MPPERQQGYAEVMTRKSNRRFENTCPHFHTENDHLDEVEVEQNKDGTKTPWHLSKGFQVLKQRIQDSCTYVAFVGKPISNKDALNMFTIVITITRLFMREHQDWHVQPPAQKPLNTAFIWWAEKVRIVRKYDRVAGSMGPGEE